MDGKSSKGSSAVDPVLHDYRIETTIGIGSFSKVKRAVHILTGHKVAIKILDRGKMKETDNDEKCRREIGILRLLMHPHVIRLYEVIETCSKIYVVMEYAESGELFDYIVQKRMLKKDEARKIFQQIISGVEYCHRNMVAHRDLKPENILLDSNCDVKIADFGLSNVMREGYLLKTSCGSPDYAAPEVLSGKFYAGSKVDVWSCGVILYALLCGTLPFQGENIPTLYKRIKGGIYTFPAHIEVGAKDLITRMLVVDPMKRMIISEIRQHPWFSQAQMPQYLAVPTPDTLQQGKMIDEDIFLEVVKMGFDSNQLIDSLCKRLQNQATVVYYLLMDNRFRATTDYLGAKYLNHVELGFASMSPGETTSPIVQHLSACIDHQGTGLISQLPAEEKWALGLQSVAHPREMMNEVLKTLHQLNVCWKKIGHYNMKCKWFPVFPHYNKTVTSNPSLSDEHTIVQNDGICVTSSNIVKFELQLYKTLENKYVLDLQRISGPHFIFLDICAAFLAELRLQF